MCTLTCNVTCFHTFVKDTCVLNIHLGIEVRLEVKWGNSFSMSPAEKTLRIMLADDHICVLNSQIFEVISCKVITFATKRAKPSNYKLFYKRRICLMNFLIIREINTKWSHKKYCKTVFTGIHNRVHLFTFR